jgi:SrtB family sortase
MAKNQQQNSDIRVLPVFPAEENVDYGIKKSGFAKAIVPYRGDTPLEVIRKFVFIISLLIAVFCFYIIMRDLRAGHAHVATYDDVRQTVAHSLEQFEMSGSVALRAEAVEEMLEDDPAALMEYAAELAGFIPLPAERIFEILRERPGIQPQYITTYDRNSDLVGWIKIPNADIDYPVLQLRRYLEDGTAVGSNEYYLHHDIDHNPSKHGSAYAEWRFPFTAAFRPDNTVLYGHNMGDGTMFGPVARYYPYHVREGGSLNFYLNNPLIYFDTIYGEGVYKVFAAMFVHTEEDKYDDVYDYFRKREFPDKESFYDFIQNIMDRSGFYTNIDIEYGDEILTLSTCYYPFTQAVDSRVAVFARRVREGESTHVDLSAAYINPSPLYFGEYYRRMGGSWAGRNWDTSLIKGLDEFLKEQDN